MKEEYLNQLESANQRDHRDHTVGDSTISIKKWKNHIIGDSSIPIKEWEALGNPHVWCAEGITYEEKDLKIEVFTDVSYAMHSVFINGVFNFMFKETRVFNTPTGDVYLVADSHDHGIGEYAAIFKLMEYR